jgi:hypothetical protein
MNSLKIIDMVSCDKGNRHIDWITVEMLHDLITSRDFRTVHLCSAHIKRFEGEVERPFAAQELDHQGLTGMKSFNEFDLSGFTAGGTDVARKSRSGKHSRKKEKRRGDKRSHSRTDRERQRHRTSRDEDGRRAKKHKSTKSASASTNAANGGNDPQALIKRYVNKGQNKPMTFALFMTFICMY